MSERLTPFRECVALGRYREAKVVFERLGLEGWRDCGEALEAHHLAVWCLLKLQEPARAAVVAEAAIQMAESASEREQARAWYDRGAVSHVLSEWADAIDAYRYCLNLSLADGTCKGRLYANIAYCYRAIRNHPQALAHYRLALSELSSAQDVEGLLMATHNAAWLLAIMERLDEARTYAGAAGELLESLEADECEHHRYQHLLLLTHIALRGGDCVTASGLLVEADENHPGATPSTLAQRTILCGELALATGNWSDALECSDRATAMGMALRDTNTLRDAERIRQAARVHVMAAGGCESREIH